MNETDFMELWSLEIPTHMKVRILSHVSFPKITFETFLHHQTDLMVSETNRGSRRIESEEIDICEHDMVQYHG